MQTLEHVIKQQKAFSSIQEKTLVNILLSYHELSNALEQIFSEYQISGPQFNVLRIIFGAQEEVSTAYIKNRMLGKNSDCSRIVDRMIQKEWLFKTKSKQDARLIHIQLTKVGVQLVKKVSKNIQKNVKSIISLDEQECNQLNHLLNKNRLNN